MGIINRITEIVRTIRFAASPRLYGRSSSGAGNGEEISIGSGLTLVGGVLSATGSSTIAWSEVTGKPATFAPSAHTHTSADITDATTTGEASKLVKVNAGGNLVCNILIANTSLDVGSEGEQSGMINIINSSGNVGRITNANDANGVELRFPTAGTGTEHQIVVTSDTDGRADKLHHGTISGVTTLNSTSYTYGTGAAAAHVAALGLPATGDIVTLTGTQTLTNKTLTTPTIAQINGGAAANDDLTLQGTTNATRTTSYVNIQPNGGNVGIGTTTPAVLLHVAAGTTGQVYVNNNSSSVAAFYLRNENASGPGLFVQSGCNYLQGDLRIGTTTANPCAALEVASTTKGVLLPRLTTTQRDAISTPLAGLMIYNTTTNKLNVYTTTWEQDATWEYLVANWSSEPTLNTAISGGEVYNYTLNGTTRYRFVPTTYYPTQDAFYSTFTSGTLSNLIVTRG